jgi:sterol 3beta-glucosyltransferase
MTINLLALGSRGDVEPITVLGAALHARGVDARVLALAEYAGLADELGAPFVPIPGAIADPIAQTHTALGRLVFTGPIGQAILLRRWLSEMAPVVADVVLEMVAPGESLLSGILTREVVTALAQARGCRTGTIVHTAMLPTAHRESHWSPQFFSGFTPYDRWGAQYSWSVASTLGRPVAREVRTRLGLPAAGSRACATAAADKHPVLVAASPLIVPPAPDWAPNVHQCGYPATPLPDYTPSAELAEFIAGGPPVYVGFGSMSGSVGHHNLDAIVEAAARAQQRVLTPALPGTAPGRVDDLVLTIGSVPFGWLFPHMAANVHHGGAGTTYAGLLAGVPSVALPFGVDQPFHASRLHALGVGPAPFPVRRLTGPLLATLLGELTTSPRAAAYREHAKAVGAQARAEDGLGTTIALLDELGYR